jgi:hypothetical protein
MPNNKAIRAQLEKLHVEICPVSALKPNRCNARIHSDKQVHQIALGRMPIRPTTSGSTGMSGSLGAIKPREFAMACAGISRIRDRAVIYPDCWQLGSRPLLR